MASRKVAAKAIEPYKCLPLEENLAPTWTSVKAFEKWHSDIWKPKVNPKNFGRGVFTKDCVMEGPRKEDRIESDSRFPGNVRAAAFFAAVFFRYPNLSGEHLSWAYNDNQVFFNWCFVTTGAPEVVRVPAMDVFCIDKGKIAYRLTTFDMDRLQEALNNAYPLPLGGPAREQVPMGYLWTRLHQEPTLPTALSLR